MVQQLDAKRYTISSILEELRKYNPEIGEYEKSMLSEDFNYSVKLSNGFIKISEELITDYERAATAITKDRYKSAAKIFKPN